MVAGTEGVNSGFTPPAAASVLVNAIPVAQHRDRPGRRSPEDPEDMVGAEADYLERCTGSRFGLGTARKKFPQGRHSGVEMPDGLQKGEFHGGRSISGLARRLSESVHGGREDGCEPVRKQQR